MKPEVLPFEVDEDNAAVFHCPDGMNWHPLKIVE